MSMMILMSKNELVTRKIAGGKRKSLFRGFLERPGLYHHFTVGRYRPIESKYSEPYQVRGTKQRKLTYRRRLSSAVTSSNT